MGPPTNGCARRAGATRRIDSVAAGSGSGVTNVCDCVSVNDLTIRAAIIAGLAILALVLTGWRKTARATPKTSRGTATTPRQVPIQRGARADARRTTPPTRCSGSSPCCRAAGLVLLVGAVIATVSAFAIAVIVTTMTNLLKD